MSERGVDAESDLPALDRTQRVDMDADREGVAFVDAPCVRAAVVEKFDALHLDRMHRLLGAASPTRRPSRTSRRAAIASLVSPSNTTLPVAEHDPPVAQLRNLLRRVADEDDRASLFAELRDALHALALEGLVADGEHLVDEKDVGIGVHGDREREAHVHAGRVELDLPCR